MAATKTRRVCLNGHTFYKCSDCPTCPTCEATHTPQTSFLAELGAPARRALEHRGITTLTALATYSERELLTLHGMGPRSLPTLRNALRRQGLAFKDASDTQS